MRNKFLVIGFVVAAMVVTSYANTFSPVGVTATVEVWTGTYISAQQQADASNPLLLTTPTWTFTYTGPINFINNCPQSQSSTCNTFQNFFGSNASGISGLSPTDLTTFLGSIASLPNNGSGTGLASLMFFDFNLNTTAGTAGLLTHDDGASLYGPGGTTLVYSPALTSEISNAFNYSGPGAYNLYYVEANGSPSDLTLGAVPEPSSLLLLGSGLMGLAGIVRRKLSR